MQKLSNSAGRVSAGGSVGRTADPMLASADRSLKMLKQAAQQRERAELASQKRIVRQRLSDEKTVERAKDAADRRTARSYVRERQRAIREGEKAGRSTAANEIKVHQEQQRFVRSTLGGGASRVIGTVGAIGKAGITAAGIAGSALTAASLGHAIRLDETSRRLAIAGRAPGEAGVSPEAIRSQFVNVGNETGINPEALATGVSSFVAKTGDLKTGLANMRNFAIAAQATGAEVEHIARAGADLAEKFDIKKTEDMAEAMAILAFQGKKGAFELKDMAEQFPEMAAAASRAGMSGVGGLRTLGGLAQIARQSTGSGSEASTALQMMLTQLVTKADKLKSGKALGGEKVNVFEGGDPTKKARDIPTVLSEIISQSEGNQTELAKVFDIRGTRAVSPLIKVYRDASEGYKGNKDMKREAGKQAVLSYIADKSESGGSWKELNRDAKDAMQSTAVQLEMLKVRLETAVASAFFPAMQRLVPELERLIPYVGRLAEVFMAMVDTFIQNPLSGVAAIITASIVKDLAAAGLGTAAKMAVEGALSKWAVGAGVLGLLIGAFEVGQMVVKTMLVDAQSKVDNATRRADEVRGKALGELKEHGRLSPETRLALDQLALDESRTINAGKSVLDEGVTDTAGRAARSLGNVLGLNDETGTLGEGAALGKAVSDENYRWGAHQTSWLTDLDDMAARMTNGAEEVRNIMKEGATEAKNILVQGAKDAPAPPNRGEKPTGIKQ